MIERVWNSIKLFFTNEAQHQWLELFLLYLIVAGIIIIITLLILSYIKSKKERNELNKKIRKFDKEILKFLSNKKNKTY